MNSIQACGYKSAYITSTVIASVMPFCIWTVWFVKYGFCCFYDIWWLVSIEIAQHCFLSSVLSPVSNDDSRCAIQYLNLEHAIHSTWLIQLMILSGPWNRLVSGTKCPILVQCTHHVWLYRNLCEFVKLSPLYQIGGSLPKQRRKLYFQVRTNLGPAHHVNDLIGVSR